MERSPWRWRAPRWGRACTPRWRKLVADQLDVAWDQVRAVHPPTSSTTSITSCWRKALEGAAARSWILGRDCEGSGRIRERFFSTMQLTGGSAASVRDAWEPMRRASDAARAMLIQAAAKRGVSAKQLDTSAGKVRRWAIRCHVQLWRACARSGERRASEAVLPRGEPYRLVGMQAARLDTTNKVNGKAKFRNRRRTWRDALCRGPVGADLDRAARDRPHKDLR